MFSEQVRFPGSMLRAIRATWLALALLSLVFSGCSDSPEQPKLPRLTVTPQQYHPAPRAEGENPDQLQIAVESDMGDSLEFRVQTDPSHLTFDVVLMAPRPKTPDTVFVFVRVPGLGVGVYYDTITFVASGVANSPVYLEVKVVVAPRMQLSPQTLFFSGLRGKPNPAPKQVSVESASGSEQMSYVATGSAGWLSITNGSGVTPGTFDVAVDLGSLSPGLYRSDIQVTSDAGRPSPQTVVCSLLVLSWESQQTPGLDYDMNQVHFTSSGRGVVSGQIGGQPGSGLVLSTGDGGLTWVLRALPVSPLGGIDFLDDNTAWVVGSASALLRTSNGGTTWQSVGPVIPEQIDLQDIDFADGQRGWIVGAGGLILHSGDGGSSWEEQVSGTDRFLSRLVFVDTLSGWAVGNGGTVLHTSDGGQTWSAQAVGQFFSLDLQDVSFVDNQLGWIASEFGKILHTADGGANWVVQHQYGDSTIHFWAITFVDEFSGWAAGRNGTILHTFDGGQSWVLQPTGTTTWLRGMFFLPSGEGWAVGDGGTILHTSSGGN